MFQLRCEGDSRPLVCLYFDTPEEAVSFAETELPICWPYWMVEKF